MRKRCHTGIIPKTHGRPKHERIQLGVNTERGFRSFR
jgi:hypothetical protein